jgi:pimeloyl-ACP methyl ester carboxylesterase
MKIFGLILVSGLRGATIALVLAGMTACAPSGPMFEAGKCPANLQAKDIACGIVHVPENYDAPGGRRIPLSVIVLHATEAQQKKVAAFDLEGGPGFSATKAAAFYVTEGASFRRSRDIVLADQRGTGNSGALRCPSIEAYDRQRPVQPLYPTDLVKDCATSLSREHDLTQYTTAASARDIDQIRKALGYEQFSLFALSYGTTLALRYIADYGANVQSAVLLGPVPASGTPPRHHATVATQALDLLISDCASDAACRQAFPNPRADLAAATARLDARGGFARVIFMERMRTLMYTPAGARQVPFLLNRAASDNFAAFELATKPGDGSAGFADGLYLSITCGETFARIDVAEAIQQAAATPFGAYRLERQREACAHWPTAPADAKLFDAPVSDVPALFVVGAFDPVASPKWASAAAKQFSKGRVVTLPTGAHVLDGLSDVGTCFDAQLLAFADAARVDAFDAACTQQMKPPPYRTKLGG